MVSGQRLNAICLHIYMSCVFQTARVAVVKSRDMHWSLLAQRDQRDISLSSLRMLIVADGANPCEYKLKQNSLKAIIISNRMEHILNCHQNIVYVLYIIYVFYVLKCRVYFLLRCLPQRLSGPRAAARGDLPMCKFL